MNKMEIAKGVYYVGAVDWNMRDFHGYRTPRGVTYNAYLIVDEKITLIDTVKAPFAEELLSRISEIVDPAKIDYVITNHVEPDHSSALPRVMQEAVNAKVVVTAAGKAEVVKHYHKEFDFMVVKAGDSLNIGKNTLHFVPLPMVHWPDSMVTFMEGENVFFSNDAFGQHICTSKRFDDENELSKILFEAEKYYANILMPLSKQVAKAVDAVLALPWEIKMIAPSHGVIWRSHMKEIIAQYQYWSAMKNEDKVVIVYETMWGSTEKMAEMILEGIAASGVKGVLYRLSVSDRSEIARDIQTAAGVLVGSSTIHNGLLPDVGCILTYIKGLRPANKITAAFGSYGWGGGAQRDAEEFLQAAGLELLPGYNVKWVPTDEERQKAFDFGFDFGKKVLERRAGN